MSRRKQLYASSSFFANHVLQSGFGNSDSSDGDSDTSDSEHPSTSASVGGVWFKYKVIGNDPPRESQRLRRVETSTTYEVSHNMKRFPQLLDV